MSRLFLEIPQIMTRCDKMWQDMPSCPKLSTSGEEISMTQENWQKQAKTTVTYNIQENMRVRRDFLNKAMLHPSWSHPCPRPLNPQPAPTCRYACKKSSFGERERSVQNRERKNSLDVKHHIIATCFSLVQFTGVWLSMTTLTGIHLSPNRVDVDGFAALWSECRIVQPRQIVINRVHNQFPSLS